MIVRLRFEQTVSVEPSDLGLDTQDQLDEMLDNDPAHFIDRVAADADTADAELLDWDVVG